MKKWNDVYQMVKNGDLDASLLKTGCEDLKAARERAAQVMDCLLYTSRGRKAFQNDASVESTGNFTDLYFTQDGRDF